MKFYVKGLIPLLLLPLVGCSTVAGIQSDLEATARERDQSTTVSREVPSARDSAPTIATQLRVVSSPVVSPSPSPVKVDPPTQVVAPTGSYKVGDFNAWVKPDTNCRAGAGLEFPVKRNFRREGYVSLDPTPHVASNGGLWFLEMNGCYIHSSTFSWARG